jgi:hypothetical protein
MNVEIPEGRGGPPLSLLLKSALGGFEMKRASLRGTLLWAVTFLLTGSSTVVAQHEPGHAAPTAAQEEPEKQESEEEKKKDPYKDFEELTEDATAREGFFDTYEKSDKLYMAIPQDRLGEEFLLAFQIAQGIGGRSLYGGTMLDIFEGALVSLERHGDRVYLIRQPHRFTGGSDPAVERAVELTFSPSVVQSAKIESFRPDSALVIDINGWLISDLSNISRRVKSAVSETRGQPGAASLDKELSYLEGIKAFPKNVNAVARLTFKPGKPISISSVPDDRFISVAVHYTMAELPAKAMAPRMADDRVGNFLTVHKDFSQYEKTFFKRLVNKWRLEPARGEQPDGSGLVEPAQPIVFYIDRTVPAEYRPFMVAGVEEWNRAFEAAGFKNAIRAEPLPDGADAEDVRYATLRWNVSDQPGYGAIGPSMVDPRSGEILDADILFEANMILGWKRAWRTLVTPTAAVEEMLDASPEEIAAMSAGGEMATLGTELSAQGSLLRAALAARGELDPNAPVPMDYVGEALKWVTMHEVGHSLGLRHNFRSSYDTPLDRLHDRDWAEERGLTGSVMEYPTINLAPNGEPNGYFYTPTVGTYDRWAIAYAYTTDPARADRLAREAAADGHQYGTDEDARGSGALDPTTNVYDLSGDPLDWAIGRADLVRSLWPELPQAVLADNSPYYDLRDAFRTTLVQYVRAVAVGVKYLGGQYLYRDHVGDPDGRRPFMNVPKERQQKALRFMTEYGFGEAAFGVPRELLEEMGANRWSHWGNENTIDGRIDYPLLEEVLSFQRTLLNQLTLSARLARILDAELKYGSQNVVTIPELMSGITESVWREVWSGGARDISAGRRDLQRAYIHRFSELLVRPPAGLPADARSVARHQLTEVQQRISAQLRSPESLDSYTVAHLEEASARIQQALDASLQAQLSG